MLHCSTTDPSPLRSVLSSLSGAQNDLYDAIFFVAKFFVHLRRIFQTCRMRHDETRVNLTSLNLCQKRLSVGLNVRLPCFYCQPLVHSGADRNFVSHPYINAWNRDRACLSTAH